MTLTTQHVLCDDAQRITAVVVATWQSTETDVLRLSRIEVQGPDYALGWRTAIEAVRRTCLALGGMI